jgi:D-3-phosphoglycerate dehydrogenase
MARIFLTHTPEALRNYYGERAVAGLAALGEMLFVESATPLPTKKLIESSAECEIIVSDRQTPGEAALFDNSPNLVAFVRCAVDIRTVDVESASKNGILVTNASPGFVNAVVELIIGFMVDLSRNISGYSLAYREGRIPEVRMGRQLAGATLGVIGYGAIGIRMAEIGEALGMSVLVSDPYKSVEEREIKQVALEDLLEGSDFVVCLAVAKEETENLIDAAAFDRMKETAFFINASRGNLVDEAALEDALRGRRIAGAAMDVGRAPDQMPSPHLARMPNVLATPHIGGLTPAAIEAQALETVEQVREILAGRLPHNAVNGAFATRLKRFADD